MKATAPTEQRSRGAKMTIEVYTVSRDGVVSPPRATVSVPHDQTPELTPLSTAYPPCRCPRCVVGGRAAR
ncbi:hypothetical protein StrepF001_12745 [Streptomyces sp. F001]|uniref:hypothetical protein n=1 Tax=Streptomyces sp. F001 TaxID=1510026 RepID=UPI00101E5DB9|nr:hypothetical protein [Streptomyces sp. F001]RZB19592.1 hypothetical protein StrepF001_12745 [Streptomyces sp. F001]